MSVIDETHDPRRESWVASARGHAEFPIQNLPFGVFSPSGGAPRSGVGIGDAIFDLKAGLEAGLVTCAAARAAGPRPASRKRLSALPSADNPERGGIEALSARLLHNAADCTMHLPAAIGSYPDFFAGLHHA